ncbi:hypothetical protein ACP70R_014708 [Stipagrostis hirtigluma subsp. patula]
MASPTTTTSRRCNGLGGGHTWRRLLLVFLQLMVVLVPGVAHGEKISAIFMFGDSIVDPGNNNGLLTAAKANFPPYGLDFPGGVATGRFSNGKIFGDLFASKLGIKELLPPYLGVDLQLNDILSGVSFASGGSGYDPLTSKVLSARSSAEQLKLFHDYKEKLTALVGKEEMTRAISQAIFFTLMGTNDLMNNYFIVPLRKHEYDLPSYVDFLVSSAINFTMTLNGMGAKKIGFFGLPPLGCLPSQRTLGGGGGPSKECDPLKNKASELFNSKISKEIDRLNAERNVDGSRLFYIDIYYNFLDLVQNPVLYGFKEASKGCCGSTVFDSVVFIAYHKACPNHADYIFWDGYHPTEKAYNILVDKLIKQNIEYLM